MTIVEYNRDLHPLEAKPLVVVELIDVAAHAIELYGSKEKAAALLPPGVSFLDHDYRFHIVLPSGAECTFHRGATAERVAAYLLERGEATAS